MELTYASYLKIDELLSLQKAESDPPEHDEMLFIIIHQVYELWFKLILHEFDKISRDLSAGDLFGAIASFKRARMVLKTLVGQLDVLETMTPMSFMAFRSRLQTASGFQSEQFRELEFLLGYKRPDMLKYQPPGSAAYARLEKRLNEPSLVDHFYDFLATRGVAIPAALKNRDLTQPNVADASIQNALLDLYRKHPDVGILMELMTDFDEGMQEWRYRHVKMVERTIGDQPGTGGSPGAAYLRKTLFMPLFPDLWAIRSRF